MNKQKWKKILGWWRGFPRRRRWLFSVLLLGLLWYTFSLPHPLFKAPLSIVLEDRSGRLLGARIAADGQWRFPVLEQTPEKFATAIITFEDKRFRRHPGVDIRALARAMVQNIRSRRVVSGGSTLSMQVVRLARGNRSRNLWQKGIELILATRLEWRYSKDEILNLYASYAPFGGNVVGLEAASWRYFGKAPDLLSWSEAATLAVLPNSPALIHMGRNREQLLEKRNRLLDRLAATGKLDALGLELAKSEELPAQPYPLPQWAPHLLDRVVKESRQSAKARIRTSIDANIQNQVLEILNRRYPSLVRNEIHNLAALVVDVPTGEVLAYVGNAPEAGSEHSPAVDIIQAPRSTGSILKPILYTLMLQEGQILPPSLIPDIPTRIGSYQPENYARQYDGMAPAKRALSRSLNVPLVLMLQQYGVEKFHYKLRKLGFSFINKPPDHYGLSLILGGAEASLWQITGTYAGMSRTLGHFYELDGRYADNDFRPPHFRLSQTPSLTGAQRALVAPPQLSAGPIWLAFQAMQQLERPDSEGDWELFHSSRRIAWKTGTSFGFRDAWAVGVDARFAVGVWSGNADGEGRPGLVGVQTSAPLLFDIFNVLPAGGWFDPPYDDLEQITLCRESGYRPLPFCPVDTIWGPPRGGEVRPCPYHQEIHLDLSGKWQVNQACTAPGELYRQSWFVLPPAAAYYFQMKNPAYRPAPPFRPDCLENVALAPGENLQLIYPKPGAQIFLPLDLDGTLSGTVFHATHRLPQTTIYWHLDETFLGSTTDFHEMLLQPGSGRHKITLVDQYGQRLEQFFVILSRGE